MSDPSPSGASDSSSETPRDAEVFFEEHYRRFSGGLARFVAQHVPERAEELASEAWVETWRALESGRYDPSRGAFSTFLYAITWKVLLRHRRSTQGRSIRRGSEELLASAAEQLSTGDDPVDAIELAQRLTDLRTCLEVRPIGALTEEERHVIRSLYFDGSTERDLAARCSVSPSTMHDRKVRALEALARCLNRKGHRR